MKEFVRQLVNMVKPSAGTKVSRLAGVQDVLMFNVSVYCPSGHFGQASALGIAIGSESFKKWPGLQHKIRFPGGTEFAICVFQLGEHHAPCLNAEVPKIMSVIVRTLDTSHVDMSELKAVAIINVVDKEVTLDTSHVERSELKALAVSNVPSKVVTLDTSHVERSELKASAPLNV